MKYLGKDVVVGVNDDGTPTLAPGRHFPGVPTRDLNEADIANIDDEVYENLIADPPEGVDRLYKVVDDDDDKDKKPKRVRNRNPNAAPKNGAPDEEELDEEPEEEESVEPVETDQL